MKVSPRGPDPVPVAQVMKCPRCGGERTIESEYVITKVIVPPCRLCGSALYPKADVDSGELVP
jgi:hypothetical protein